MAQEAASSKKQMQRGDLLALGGRGVTPTSTCSVWGTHRGRVQAARPLLSLHGPPAVRAHPQWQVQHVVALGSHGKGQSARRLNPALQK